MSETLNILLKKEEYDDNSKTLRQIHDGLINSILFENFSGVFDYFSLWDESNDSFFGKDKPNEMKQIVSESITHD